MNCSIKLGCYNVRLGSNSYLQDNFSQRFDGAVSITVVLKDLGFETRVEGSSPSKTFFYCFRKEAGIFLRFTCLQKKHVLMYYAHVKRPLSKMTRLVWRYSDDAGAIIEIVYKFCMEEKKSGMKLSLNRVWGRTAALTGVSRSTAQKSVEEKKAQDEQQQPKQPPSSTSKVSLDDFDKGVVRRTIASMYSLKKVLPTLDNIRTELKQSIGYTGSNGRLRKDLLHTKSASTRCGVNQKVLMERQYVVLSRTRYLRMVRELRETGSALFIKIISHYKKIGYNINVL